MVRRPASAPIPLSRVWLWRRWRPVAVHRTRSTAAEDQSSLSYSFRLPDPSLTDGVRRIARSQIETAVAEIDDETLGPVTTVHQLRKRCKKVRGLVRLVRPGFKAYGDENAAFRDLSRGLADLRDAGALLETVAALEARFGDVIGGTFFADVRGTLAAASPPADDQDVSAAPCRRPCCVRSRPRPHRGLAHQRQGGGHSGPRRGADLQARGEDTCRGRR